MSPVDRIAHTNRWRHKSLVEKASLALGMLVLVLFLPPFPSAPAVTVIMTTTAVVWARVPTRIWLACAAAPIGFLLVGAISLLIRIDAGAISLAPGGGEAAAALVARSLAGVSCLMFLSLTTPAADLIFGLRRLGVPAEVTEIALLTYRFVFLFAGTAISMDAAQAARLGHDGYKRRLRSLGMLIANLLPRAFDRAHRLEVGLAARSWQGEMRVVSPRASVSPWGLLWVLLTEGAVGATGLVWS